MQKVLVVVRGLFILRGNGRLGGRFRLWGRFRFGGFFRFRVARLRGVFLFLRLGASAALFAAGLARRNDQLIQLCIGFFQAAGGAVHGGALGFGPGVVGVAHGLVIIFSKLDVRAGLVLFLGFNHGFQPVDHRGPAVLVHHKVDGPGHGIGCLFPEIHCNTSLPRIAVLL